MGMGMGVELRSTNLEWTYYLIEMLMSDSSEANMPRGSLILTDLKAVLVSVMGHFFRPI